MKENIDRMHKRHEMEIKNLQDNCPHRKISGWIEYHWAVGHYSHDVKVCLFCGKIVEENKGGMDVGGRLVENREGILCGQECDRARCPKEGSK